MMSRNFSMSASVKPMSSTYFSRRSRTVGAGYFFRKNCLFHLRRNGLRAAMLRAILSAGVPTVVNQLSLVLLALLVNRILRAVEGNIAVAA